MDASRIGNSRFLQIHLFITDAIFDNRTRQKWLTENRESQNRGRQKGTPNKVTSLAKYAIAAAADRLVDQGTRW